LPIHHESDDAAPPAVEAARPDAVVQQIIVDRSNRISHA
jgi:hypothetical protein